MADTQQFKCPCCGGAIVFDSGVQKMKCPYCDTEFEMETLKKLEDENNNPAKDDMQWDTSAANGWQQGEEDSMLVYVCKSCGGEIMADSNTAATSCPFCGNPVVINGKLSGQLRPDFVIPFKLDKAAAIAGLSKHLTGKKLLPKVFKDQNHIKEVKGVYVPYWMFNADTNADISYTATRVRYWSDSQYNYIGTSYYDVKRSGSLSFKNIPEDGSTKMADDLTESIEPFDMADAVDFQTAYLSGYLADKYDVTADDAVPRANKRIKSSTEKAFAETVKGYASVVPKQSSVHTKNGSARYALLPVWVLSTEWRGTNYIFAMNGQTGKFVGNLPVDKGLLAKWWFIYFGIGAAVAGLLALLIG